MANPNYPNPNPHPDYPCSDFLPGEGLIMLMWNRTVAGNPLRYEEATQWTQARWEQHKKEHRCHNI